MFKIEKFLSPYFVVMFFPSSELDIVFPLFPSDMSQQKWGGEFQQSGQPGEGLRGQIQARPQEMKRRPSAGVAAMPSQTHSAAQVQFPLAGIWPPS